MAKKEKMSNIRIVILAFAVISFWRGCWALLDIYLLPNAPTASAIASIVLGLVIMLWGDFHLNELKEG